MGQPKHPETKPSPKIGKKHNPQALQQKRTTRKKTKCRKAKQHLEPKQNRQNNDTPTLHLTRNTTPKSRSTPTTGKENSTPELDLDATNQLPTQRHHKQTIETTVAPTKTSTTPNRGHNQHNSTQTTRTRKRSSELITPLLLSTLSIFTIMALFSFLANFILSNCPNNVNLIG